MEPNNEIRVSVIGVGHLGKAHARICTEIPGFKLVSLADTNADRAREMGERYGVPWTPDYRDLAGDPQAVVVVVPTRLHHEVAAHFLKAGVHVLVEKPMTTTLEEADDLVELAAAKNLILQVGHVERFNPVMTTLKELEIKPRYLESHRVAPFTFRSTDVGVTMDLMIHDLDIVLSLTKGEVVDVEAFGGSVFTGRNDLASARLKFSSGEIANLTTSRVALKPSRKLRLFSKDAYVSMDFSKGYGVLIKKGPAWDEKEIKIEDIDPTRIENLWKFVYEGLLTVREINSQEAEPLREELISFKECICEGNEPVVSGQQGRRALALALEVEKAVSRHPW